MTSTPNCMSDMTSQRGRHGPRAHVRPETGTAWKGLPPTTQIQVNQRVLQFAFSSTNRTIEPSLKSSQILSTTAGLIRTPYIILYPKRCKNGSCTPSWVRDIFFRRRRAGVHTEEGRPTGRERNRSRSRLEREHANGSCNPCLTRQSFRRFWVF